MMRPSKISLEVCPMVSEMALSGVEILFERLDSLRSGNHYIGDRPMFPHHLDLDSHCKLGKQIQIPNDGMLLA